MGGSLGGNEWGNDVFKVEMSSKFSFDFKEGSRKWGTNLFDFVCEFDSCWLIRADLGQLEKSGEF